MIIFPEFRESIDFFNGISGHMRFRNVVCVIYTVDYGILYPVYCDLHASLFRSEKHGN